jgi:hypothetical protein
MPGIGKYRKIDPDMAKKIIRIWKMHTMNLNEMGVRFGISGTAIAKLLEKEGIRSRRKGETHGKER